MKTKYWLIGIVAAVLIGVAGWTSYAQRTQRVPQPPAEYRPPVWEYKVVYVPGARQLSEAMMNKLGAEGWEFVAFQTINNEGGTIGAGNCYFKRASQGKP